ncbi:CDP-diacylglycerol--glycerol-3-phosphate 3-phosphatidyltransferase, mitochondrial [Protopterus annectens]|uniref:CDP-diacylglycerol--glycerol-3-phosphate 3-phosphatidyltransferase, mitochondrial n=1 Tax=Protopterus annectens TaxID=7888 RepID=UPI001CFA997F|nr:CDP-diacylglycerol--glycerol-3-phosphate 3-phosphatidyltransferase, mitochondrial [Protopterus annectens]XP_043924099.1 CDP-diacylglycerol--glycerol-3-phosphate 3-phosphatidyltransferase, mitochondrial [Protopterus annectens]
MAAPMVSWKRLFSLLCRPSLAGAWGRITDRFARNRDRGGRKKRRSWLLFTPLFTPVMPSVAAEAPIASRQYLDGVHRFQWIGNLVPEFLISSSQVKVLFSPAEFYNTMKDSIKVAKKRVVMASLYLGTGSLEQELVNCLQQALELSVQENQISSLRVSVLLDFTRGSRGKKNSRTMLLPLLKKFPDQIRISLYHTPDLRGILKLLMPERFNETIGLQHIKVYLFDDDVILSGANLSDSYFTNRQDRYILLKGCSEIADFFEELVNAIGDASLQLQQDDTVKMKRGMVHPYQGCRSKFCKAANQRIMEVVNSTKEKQQHHNTTRERLTDREQTMLSDTQSSNDETIRDTWVYPLIQMKPFGIRLDEMITKALLTEAEEESRIFLTSGYFNLTRTYMDLVLHTRADYQILLASPEVNGFFGAKGVAGAIPAAYVYIACQFYDRVCQLGMHGRIHLHEYFRKDWTFHAKGLWYYLSGSSLPCLTLIGSPNFGYRSVHRDLEAQVAIVTENIELQRQLYQEQEQLYCRSSEISSSTFQQPNRYVKLWVKLVTPLIKNFF